MLNNTKTVFPPIGVEGNQAVKFALYHYIGNWLVTWMIFLFCQVCKIILKYIHYFILLQCIQISVLQLSVNMICLKSMILEIYANIHNLPVKNRAHLVWTCAYEEKHNVWKSAWEHFYCNPYSCQVWMWSKNIWCSYKRIILELISWLDSTNPPTTFNVAVSWGLV